MKNINSHLDKDDKKNHLRIALMIWKNKNNLINDKIKDNVNKGTEKIKKVNTLKNGPKLLDNTKKNANNQKKKKLLRAGVRRRGKNEKLIEPFSLAKYFLRWKNKADDKKFRNKHSHLQKKMLTHLVRYEDKPNLMRYWYKWKNNGLVKKNNFPVLVGTQQLRNAVVKKPYDKFKKVASMMNLKIPRGVSLQQALIRGKKNEGKSIALRNFASKPYFRRWKNIAKKMDSDDMKHNIFLK